MKRIIKKILWTVKWCKVVIKSWISDTNKLYKAEKDLKNLFNKARKIKSLKSRQWIYEDSVLTQTEYVENCIKFRRLFLNEYIVVFKNYWNK